MSETILIGVVAFCMYVQFVMNTGDTARALKRIEKRLERDETSQL